MAARETDVMEDEILETELSSSALAISRGTEQLLMLEGFTEPSFIIALEQIQSRAALAALCASLGLYTTTC